VRIGVVSWRASRLGGRAASEPIMARTGAKTIVVVDDDETFLELLQSALGNLGYAVVTCRDAAWAPRVVKELLPDLVVLDVRARGVREGDALRRISYDVETALIPMLVCAADVVQAHMLAAHLRRRGHAFIAEPFDLDELRAKVERLIEGGPR
jgi:CheY-like chemotaxis protein